MRLDKRMEVGKHLTDIEYNILVVTYSNHNSSMNFEDRAIHDAESIVKVVRLKKDEELQVYYRNNRVFVYTNEYEWRESS